MRGSVRGRRCRAAGRAAPGRSGRLRGARDRGAVPAAPGQLEVGAGAGQLEEDAVVAGVVAEAADLRQPEAVAVEGHELGEALGVAGPAQLHAHAPALASATPTAVRSGARSPRACESSRPPW